MKSGACVWHDTSPALHVFPNDSSTASMMFLPHPPIRFFHCLKIGLSHTEGCGVTQTDPTGVTHTDFEVVEASRWR